jgi:hypothetical protein
MQNKSKEKEVEVLPPNEDIDLRAIEGIARMAEPFFKAHAENQLALSQEETKRMEMRLEKEYAIAVMHEHNKANDAWREYGVIIIALLAFVVALAFGLYNNNSSTISSSIVGISTFIGGFGLGRTAHSKPDTASR